MKFSKNKKYQFFFFLILSIIIIFNGGNSNLLIQFNFILASLFFLVCLRDKNYFLHLNYFVRKNLISLGFYSLFIFYLLFQIIPMPLNILKFLSVNKFHYINNLSSDIKTSALSLSPSDSFFQILHFLTILILIFILKMIFYSESHKRRFFLFIAFIGFISSIFAITLYLNGNPDILIFKNSFYKNSSTGFFINRTVFAIFLLFSLISCLELLKDYQVNVIYQKKDNFFLKIYIRLFLVFITIGIITSFSRIGNFLLIITILSYLLNEFFFTKQKKPFFILSIILIIIFDIMVLGIYFGASELIDRFYFSAWSNFF